MHDLLVLEPGHFHAALALRTRNPRVRPDVHVYARPGPELDSFLALVGGFNDRPVDPTDWQLHVHDGSVEELIAERRGDVVVLAGPNHLKLGHLRAMSEAGLHVLADKPWLTSPSQLPDLERLTGGAPVAMDIMTERHDVTTRLRHRVVATPSVFGEPSTGGDRPAIEQSSVHHLCKLVDGRPLRRPAWSYDIDVQGDGLVDIHSHMVDQSQWLVSAAGRADDEAEVVAARRWATAVSTEAFESSTGLDHFPEPLRSRLVDGNLHLLCNGEIHYRLGGVLVEQRTEWRVDHPAGGGDIHRSIVRGTRAVVTMRHDPTAFDGTELHVGGAELDPSRLEEAAGEWAQEFPGLEVVPSELGYRLALPATSLLTHEAHFALVLDDFLDRVEGQAPHDPAQIRARYRLLAAAQELGSRDD
jgi:predicted dehydrogenase